jgi:hypothetical protein
MALVTKLSEACDVLVQLFEDQAESLGIAEGGVFYGDQERIPVSPAVCVEPNVKKSALYGAGRMTEVALQVYVMVYHSELRDVGSNRKDADLLAETITDLLNSQANFYGNAIHCFVSEVQSGYSQKQNTTLRSTRVTFDIQSQERLPNNP